MKLKIVKIIVIYFFFLGCSSEGNSIEDIHLENIINNKILCIGDSRVEGNKPQYESYRYELWKKLVNAKYNFDFIGPFKDNGSYPKFSNLNFDIDHAGIGGDTTTGVFNRYNDNVTNNTPDIVLLGIGGNDITANISIEDVIKNISSILDLIKNKNPSAVVIIEIIAGAKPVSNLGKLFNPTLSDFKTKINDLSSKKTSGNFKVVPVNMYENFTNNLDYYADDVHYSESGAKEIALRYFNAITPYLK